MCLPGSIGVHSARPRLLAMKLGVSPLCQIADRTVSKDTSCCIHLATLSELLRDQVLHRRGCEPLLHISNWVAVHSYVSRETASCRGMRMFEYPTSIAETFLSGRSVLWSQITAWCLCFKVKYLWNKNGRRWALSNCFVSLLHGFLGDRRLVCPLQHLDTLWSAMTHLFDRPGTSA